MGGITVCGIAGWIDYSRDISKEKQIIKDIFKNSCVLLDYCVVRNDINNTAFAVFHGVF